MDSQMLSLPGAGSPNSTTSRRWSGGPDGRAAVLAELAIAAHRRKVIDDDQLPTYLSSLNLLDFGRCSRMRLHGPRMVRPLKLINLNAWPAVMPAIKHMALRRR